MKRKIKEIEPYITLYKDDNTGIAWIEDGTTGSGLSLHPNIDSSGSVAGMKKLGYWKKEDRTVQSHGFIYNIDKYVPEDNPKLNNILLEHCTCGGKHGVAVSTLSEEHRDFIGWLRLTGKHMTATQLQEHWEKGQPHYIDTRVDLKGKRREFERLNDMMRGNGEI